MSKEDEFSKGFVVLDLKGLSKPVTPHKISQYVAKELGITLDEAGAIVDKSLIYGLQKDFCCCYGTPRAYLSQHRASTFKRKPK